MPTLSEVAQVITGMPAVPSQNPISSDELPVRAIGISALTEDAEVDYSRLDEVRYAPNRNSFEAVVREGDVLLTIRGTALRAAIARRLPQEEVFASANLIILRANPAFVLPPVLWACITSFLHSQHGTQISRQSVGQVSLPVKEIRSLRFDLPPLHHQYALADAIESLLIARSAARAAANQHGVVLHSFISSQFRPLF